MRWRTRSLIAAGLGLTWATPAFACGHWINSIYLAIPTSTTVMLGLQNVEHYRIFALSGAFKVGEKVVVAPSVVQCQYTGDGGGGDMGFGGTVGVNVYKDAAGKVAVNAQAGIEMLSYDGGTERNIPIGAAVNVAASEMLDIFGGAAIQLYNDEYGGQSYSSTDPAVYAGATYKTGKIRLTGGVTMYMYDGGSEMAINIGAAMALGQASNALTRIGSLFRK